MHGEAIRLLGESEGGIQVGDRGCFRRRKVIDLFLTGGQVVFRLGLAGAACNMLGNFLGAELALKQGAKVTRPVILVVLGLLGLKIFGII